jgi:predicted enzyme related to lactoylglutathione lyase
MTRVSDRQPVGRLRWIEIDTPDPDPLVTFWSEVLGAEVDPPSNDVQPPFQYIALTAAEPGAPQVVFQRVPESKTNKNRLHFDLLVEDVDAACARIEALGGRRRDDHDYHNAEPAPAPVVEPGWSWRRMADPQGNEFCLIYGVADPQDVSQT